MNRRKIIIAVVAVLFGLILSVGITAVIAPADFFNRQVMITIAAVLTYIAWLIIYVLVIERWPRYLTEWLFGVTIRRELHRITGPSSNVSLLEVLDVFGWKVDEPASLSVRFGIGVLRLLFWLMAVVGPIALVLVLYFAFIAKSTK